MTDDDRKAEGAEEQVEDLEAPAEQLDDVAGGAADSVRPRPHCPYPWTGAAIDPTIQAD